MKSNIIFSAQEDVDRLGRERGKAVKEDKEGSENGGNRARSIALMQLRYPSMYQDVGELCLQEDIPGLPTMHLQLQVFTPGTKTGAITS